MENTKLHYKLIKTAELLRLLADSLQGISDEIVEEPKEEAEPAVSLEEVRGVLAEKSRAGFTMQVKELIAGYGANCLSDISSENYPKLMKEAEGIGDE